MTSFEIWVVIVGLMGVTFLTRGFFLIMGRRVELPDSLQAPLRYAPAAALVAIIVPEVFLSPEMNSIQAFDWTSPHLWGGLTGMLAFLLSKSMILTIFLGMLAFTTLRIF